MKSSITVVVMALVMATGMTAQAQNLPQDESSEFTGSGNCADCHSSDGTANTEYGVDISMPTLWRSTMMANAAKDPISTTCRRVNRNSAGPCRWCVEGGLSGPAGPINPGRRWTSSTAA